MLKKFRLFALCLILATPAIAQDIGWIDSIQGSPKNTKLVRDGKAQAMKPYMVIRVGDELQISDSKTVVLVSQSDGKTQRITSAQSPYKVEQSGAAPSVPGNALKYVSGLFGGKTQSDRHLQMSAMTTRGISTPLTIPYMTKRFYVVSGERALYFSWAGGKPPFKLRLIRLSDGKEIASLKNISSPSITTPTLGLQPDDYLLEVGDSGNDIYEDYLRVVPASRLPAFPSAGDLKKLPQETAKLITASWLVSAESGMWVIESLQQLKELSATNAAAKDVLNQVERGAESSER